jgi:pyocin large subunit-like protein
MGKPFDLAPYRQSTSSLEHQATADMAAAKSQALPMPAHDDGYVSERHTTSSSVPPTSALALLLAAALCNALAGRTWEAMSHSEPWWLGHAASMTIRAFSVDLINRSEAFRDFRGMLHLGVMVLGWALDRAFVYLYA